MDLFPYALLRVGGDTYACLKELRLSQSILILEDYLAAIQTKERAKNLLCDELHQYISQLKSPEEQNLLQNLRRDIFNSRKLRQQKLSMAYILINHTGLCARLKEYEVQSGRINQLAEKGKSVYLDEIQEKREVLKTLIQSQPLLKGLILSSASLFNRVPSYMATDTKEVRKKHIQAELSFMKYLSRIYTKTSPFSTFTNLGIAQYADHIKEGIEVTNLSHNPDEQIKSHVRLNNFLFKHIQSLFRNFREAYILLPLRANPTIKQEGDDFLFLTNSNNIESFQRISFSPIIEIILQTVSQHSKGLVFQELIACLSAQIEASPEELEDYLKRLIDAGFLEYYLGVSGIDPDWDIKLNVLLLRLEEMKVRGMGTLRNSLKEIRELSVQYARSDSRDRNSLLSRAYSNIKEACLEVHKTAGLPEHERMSEEERVEWVRTMKLREEIKGETEGERNNDNTETSAQETFSHMDSTRFRLKREQLFYEDTVRVSDAKIDENEALNLVSKLNQLLKETAISRPLLDERIKMSNYFLKKYGTDVDIDLLTFYEDYFRDYKRPEKEMLEHMSNENLKVDQISVDDSFLDVPRLKEKNNLLKQWSGLLSEVIRNEVQEEGMVVNLKREHLQRVNRELKVDTLNDAKGFHSAFLQPFRAKGSKHLKAVLNGTVTGYGKMLSRFLHIFPAEVLNRVREYNQELTPKDCLFVEGTDASFFNANLHPTLMSFEVWMPGGHNGVGEKYQLPIADFSIRYDATDRALHLIYKPLQQRAFVFNLGFQGSKGRSELFQLLETFTPTSTGYPQFVNRAVRAIVDERAANQVIVKIYPRITYEDDIILQRKTWQVSKEHIPEKDKQEEEWGYLARLLSWKKDLGLPDEVFVNINPQRSLKGLSGESIRKLTKDDYKPQYIDFKNPFLVHLFRKLVDKTPAVIQIQEMLPGPDELIEIDGKPFVTEFIWQWVG